MCQFAKNSLWVFKRGIFLAWVVVLVIFGQAAFAQQPLYYNINTDDGLPTNEVFEIDQDSFGHVWIGCNTGLYRYDGVRFKRYGSRFETSRAMTMMSIDNQDRIWCGNVSGQYFIREGDSLRLILKHDPNARYELVSVGLSGDLMVLHPKGLKQINREGKVVRTWMEDWPWNIESFAEDAIWRGDNVYVALPNGEIFRYNLVNSTLQRLHSLVGPQASVAGTFGAKGEAVLARFLNSEKGLGTLKILVGDAFQEIYSEQISVRDWLRIQSIAVGRVWICTQTGAKELRQEGSQWLLGPTLVPEAQLSSVLEDREGNLCFSSINKGLFLVPSAGAVKLGHLGEPLWNANITAIAALPGDALLAGNSRGEVFAIDCKTGNTRMVMEAGKELRAVKRIRWHQNSALVLRGENAWIDWPSCRVRPFRYGGMREGIVDGDTVRMIGSQLGAGVPVVGWESLEGGVPYRKVGGRCLEQEMGGGSVYWGYNDGLFVSRKTGNQQVEFEGQPIIANAMTATEEGVWVATLTHGLLLCKDGKVIDQRNHKHGLPDQAIRTLEAVGNLLIFSTDDYLIRYDLKTNDLRKVSRSAGFNPTDINQLAISGDRIWLGTITGIVVLPLDFGKGESGDLPPVRIGRVRVGDEELDPQSELFLAAGHAALRITPEGVSFSSRGNFAFEYRIPTVDTAWEATAAAVNEIVFTALPAGHHVLEVRTVDEQGRRSLHPAILRFQVASPLYQRWWFVALVAIVLIGVTIGIVEWRNRIQRRKERLQHAMAASQLTALKAQMNPHFLFNSLNSIQDLVLSKDIRNSNLYLSKFSTLMRRVLAASGQDWVMIGEEVEMLQLYLELERLRFGEEFNFEIVLNGPKDVEEMEIPTMILQPFVENAIKHGLLHKRGGKWLEIRFEVEEQAAKVIITDNGVGRKRSAEIQARSGKGSHAGFSTSATIKRLDLIQQMHGSAISAEIEDLMEGGEASGTRVVLRLPVH